MTRPTRLFLHTEPPTRRILATADRRGERWILASDWLPPESRAAFDACVDLPEGFRVADTLRALRDVRFDALTAQTEFGLLPGALLAAERGLPGPSPAAAYLCVNKRLCRRALEAAGVPVPRHALARDAAGVRAFAERFPVVLKPVASTLGRGVVLVASEAEIAPRVAELSAFLPRAPDVLRCVEFARIAGQDLGCDPTRDFLVEEFAEGEPAEADGLVFGDRVESFGITTQDLSPGPRFYIRGYVFPARRPGLEALAERVVRAVGLSDSGFSIEFRGGRVIEINGRLGEDDGFPDLFAAALGEAPILRWIRGDAAKTPAGAAGRDGPTATGGHALAYRNHVGDGVIRSAPSPAPEGVTILAPRGTRLVAPPDPDALPHLAYALRSHPSDPVAAYAEARAAVDALAFDIRPTSA